MSENGNSDEIDLIQLLLKISKTLQRNFILIVSFFLVGVFLGLLYYLRSDKIYQSQMMIVTSKTFVEPYSKDLIEKLNELKKEGNITEFAKKLNLSVEESKGVRHINIEPIDKKSETLKDDDKAYLKITTEVTKTAILPVLQKKLVEYLENNDFIKVRVEQKKKYLTSLLKKTNEEISVLEEFKTKIYKGDYFASMKGNMFDPTVVNTKILDLLKLKIEYEQSLALVNSIQVIDGFTAFQKPVSPKLIISVASGAMVGLILVGILIFFNAIRKFLKMEQNT